MIEETLLVSLHVVNGCVVKWETVANTIQESKPVESTSGNKQSNPMQHETPAESQ